MKYDESFRSTRTEISHRRTLIKALKKLGYPVFFRIKIKNSEIFPDYYDVDIATDVGAPYFVGFLREKYHNFRMIADWKGISRSSSTNKTQFEKELYDMYDLLLKESWNRFLYFIEVQLVEWLISIWHKLSPPSKKVVYKELESKYYKYPILYSIKKKVRDAMLGVVNLKLFRYCTSKIQLLINRRQRKKSFGPNDFLSLTKEPINQNGRKKAK